VEWGGRYLRRAVVIATALLCLPFPAPAHASSAWLTGIDVSSWQGQIDWSKVAGAGIKFVIAKASEGTTYADPTYGTNKSGAAANGIAFTAYHFARPTSSTTDAVSQADYFLNNAKLSAGNLIPALDLEVTGGLSTSALQSWTWAWVKEVFARLGVKPMIYTSPNFWQTYMGNTTAFADAGYDTLWIAHWTSATSPSVPANNWGGHGWTFWQWSDCQKVSGISGCVDGDRYNGTDLTPVRITSLSVSRTAGGTVTSSPVGINCGSTCRAYFDPMGSVGLAATPSAGATFLGWGGACSGASTCTVSMVGNKSVSARFGYTLTEAVSGAGPGQITTGATACTSSCQTTYVAGTSVTLKATPGPDALFSGWSGACSGTSTTCVVVMNASQQANANFGDKPPSASVTAPATLNGPIVVAFSEPVSHVSASNVDFRVTGATSPVGVAITCLDAGGAPVACSTGWATSMKVTPAVVLIPGQYYTLTIDAAAATTKIVDDGALPLAQTVSTFRASRFQPENSLAAAYMWQSVASTGALGGSYTREDLGGAQATYKFSGTGITWYTQIGPTQGQAQVAIDGVSKGTFDLYWVRTHYQIPRTFSGLTDGPHVITITALGKKNPASSSTFVSVDGFAVGGVVNPTPAVAYQWNPEYSSLAYGGRYVMANLNGETARFTFRGTAIAWATMIGPNQGLANVYIDGKLVLQVDGYAASLARAVRGVGGLTDAIHVVSIVVLGQHDRSSNNSFVSIDAWSVS
jgi:GH25 family lysozyme M1 (1,4-beta-N-acetylmuramidase)